MSASRNRRAGAAARALPRLVPTMHIYNTHATTFPMTRSWRSASLPLTKARPRRELRVLLLQSRAHPLVELVQPDRALDFCEDVAFVILHRRASVARVDLVERRFHAREAALIQEQNELGARVEMKEMPMSCRWK